MTEAEANDVGFLIFQAGLAHPAVEAAAGDALVLGVRQGLLLPLQVHQGWLASVSFDLQVLRGPCGEQWSVCVSGRLIREGRPCHVIARILGRCSADLDWAGSACVAGVATCAQGANRLPTDTGVEDAFLPFPMQVSTLAQQELNQASAGKAAGRPLFRQPRARLIL